MDYFEQGMYSKFFPVRALQKSLESLAVGVFVAPLTVVALSNAIYQEIFRKKDGPSPFYPPFSQEHKSAGQVS